MHTTKNEHHKQSYNVTARACIIIGFLISYSSIPTGEIEVIVINLHIESEVKFHCDEEIAKEEKSILASISGKQEYSENMRLKYRFLDLRREKVRNNIILRSQIIAELRRLMIEQGFLEIQTPILTASSPEGARV